MNQCKNYKNNFFCCCKFPTDFNKNTSEKSTIPVPILKLENNDTHVSVGNIVNIFLNEKKILSNNLFCVMNSKEKHERLINMECLLSVRVF